MMTHVCPRRVEVPLHISESAGETDEFQGGHGLIGQVRGCSFCGSMDPVEFLQKVREGYIVGPTDKNYKAYLDAPDGGTVGKFYFQHLSNEQRDEFVTLHNDKTMKIGYPGHFYVRPYFTSPVPQE